MSVSEQGNEAEIPKKHSKVLVLVFGIHFRYTVDFVSVLLFFPSSFTLLLPKRKALGRVWSSLRSHPHLPDLLVSGGDGRPHHLQAELHCLLNNGGEGRKVEAVPGSHQPSSPAPPGVEVTGAGHMMGSPPRGSPVRGSRASWPLSPSSKPSSWRPRYDQPLC